MAKTLSSGFAVSGPTRSLTAWVTETLRRAIVDGCFQPGERLDQDAIADELDVSRTPLRAAIAALESEGLLESRPYHGVFVAKVSLKDVREVFAVRGLLEAEVARQVASVIPDAVLDELEVMLQEGQKAYNQGDQGAPFEADRRFHEALRAFSQNSLLADVLQGLNNRVCLVRGFAQMRQGIHIDEFSQEHRGILQALRKRDADLAAHLMQAHLVNSAIRVVDLHDDPELTGT